MQRIAERAAYTCLLSSPSPRSPAAGAHAAAAGLGVKAIFPFADVFEKKKEKEAHGKRKEERGFRIDSIVTWR